MRLHFFIFICVVNSVFSRLPNEDDKHGIGIVQHEETPCGIEALIYGGVGYTNTRPGPLFDDEYLPTCSCYQNLFESQRHYIYEDLKLYKASSGSGGYGEFEGFGGGDITLPGVNCIDNDRRPIVGPERSGITYQVNLNRTVMTVKENEFFTAGPEGNNKNGYNYIEFSKTVDEDSTFKLGKVFLKNGKKLVFDSSDQVDQDSMKDICEKHTPRSIEDNLMKILRAGIFNDTECPITEGSNFTTPNSIDPFLMTFNQKMHCGYYLLNYQIDTPDTDDALALYYIFEIKENEDCIKDEK
ncbi:uncharacterized protein LOC123271773 [Cotesia glomerata]|uniref:Uncharacterized protein n=1 Tax=Cotesia glomerata TaxID=32391 RepID=A0AAV7IUQ9_COTGL|nr:uncharacterized protein LOC123271773 [Cotesia glomerata]KAH0557832.1 hypothetical protein KQX54_012135 [Cotesia glomerata]